MYVKDKVDEIGNPLTVLHEVVNDRWEVCLTMSEKGFQQVSFVNSIATTKVTSQNIRSSYLLCVWLVTSMPNQLLNFSQMSVGILSANFNFNLTLSAMFKFSS